MCLCVFIHAGVHMPSVWARYALRPILLCEQSSTRHPASAKRSPMWTAGPILPNKVLIASLISFSKSQVEDESQFTIMEL